jgi:hypothetical protein
MRSYMVVGNQTLDSPELAEAIRDRMTAEPSTFYLVVPATPIPHGFTWDEDEARTAATERLKATVDRLRASGATVSGEIGSANPIQAVQDALRRREVDEVILSTLPPGISRWLGQDVPSRLKGSIHIPVAVVTTQRQATVSGS